MINGAADDVSIYGQNTLRHLHLQSDHLKRFLLKVSLFFRFK